MAQKSADTPSDTPVAGNHWEIWTEGLGKKVQLKNRLGDQNRVLDNSGKRAQRVKVQRDRSRSLVTRKGIRIWASRKHAWNIRLDRQSKLRLEVEGELDVIQLIQGSMRFSSFGSISKGDGTRRYASSHMIVGKGYTIVPEERSHIVVESYQRSSRVVVLSGQILLEDLNSGEVYPMSSGQIWKPGESAVQASKKLPNKLMKSEQKNLRKLYARELQDLKQNFLPEWNEQEIGSDKKKALSPQKDELMSQLLKDGQAVEALFLASAFTEETAWSHGICGSGFAKRALLKQKESLKIWKDQLQKDRDAVLCRLGLAEDALSKGKFSVGQSLLRRAPSGWLRHQGPFSGRSDALRALAATGLKNNTSTLRYATRALWDANLRQDRRNAMRQVLNELKTEKRLSQLYFLAYQYDGNPLFLPENEVPPEYSGTAAQRVLGGARIGYFLHGSYPHRGELGIDATAAVHTESRFSNIDFSLFGLEYRKHLGDKSFVNSVPVRFEMQLLGNTPSVISVSSGMRIQKLELGLGAHASAAGSVPFFLRLQEKFRFPLSLGGNLTLSNRLSLRQDIDLGFNESLPRLLARISQEIPLHLLQRLTLSSGWTLEWTGSQWEEDASSFEQEVSVGPSAQLSWRPDPWLIASLGGGYSWTLPLTTGEGSERPEITASITSQL